MMAHVNVCQRFSASAKQQVQTQVLDSSRRSALDFAVPGATEGILSTFGTF